MKDDGSIAESSRKTIRPGGNEIALSSPTLEVQVMRRSYFQYPPAPLPGIWDSVLVPLRWRGGQTAWERSVYGLAQCRLSVDS
jgi:hypothetical protein